MEGGGEGVVFNNFLALEGGRGWSSTFFFLFHFLPKKKGKTTRSSTSSQQTKGLFLDRPVKVATHTQQEPGNRARWGLPARRRLKGKAPSPVCNFGAPLFPCIPRAASYRPPSKGGRTCAEPKEEERWWMKGTEHWGKIIEI